MSPAIQQTPSWRIGEYMSTATRSIDLDAILQEAGSALSAMASGLPSCAQGTTVYRYRD